MGDRARNIILGVVTAVWAANFAAPLVIPGAKAIPEINGIFMAVVGGVLLAGRREDKGQPYPPAAPPPSAPGPPAPPSPPADPLDLREGNEA